MIFISFVNGFLALDLILALSGKNLMNMSWISLANFLTLFNILTAISLFGSSYLIGVPLVRFLFNNMLLSIFPQIMIMPKDDVTKDYVGIRDLKCMAVHENNIPALLLYQNINSERSLALQASSHVNVFFILIILGTIYGGPAFILRSIGSNALDIFLVILFCIYFLIALHVDSEWIYLPKRKD